LLVVFHLSLLLFYRGRDNVRPTCPSRCSGHDYSRPEWPRNALNARRYKYNDDGKMVSRGPRALVTRTRCCPHARRDPGSGGAIRPDQWATCVPSAAVRPCRDSRNDDDLLRRAGQQQYASGADRVGRVVVTRQPVRERPDRGRAQEFHLDGPRATKRYGHIVKNKKTAFQLSGLFFFFLSFRTHRGRRCDDDHSFFASNRISVVGELALFKSIHSIFSTI